MFIDRAYLPLPLQPRSICAHHRRCYLQGYFLALHSLHSLAHSDLFGAL